ncbi:hypothetical protein V7S43_018449 [Phytophthora oleae]|uniref:Crinkler effector protein N-terminal domain-containing protein n=1 Tax=Phytophthora oleae TaxID=2107226 RepID=A0ABD3EQG0_9STRA
MITTVGEENVTELAVGATPMAAMTVEKDIPTAVANTSTAKTVIYCTIIGVSGSPFSEVYINEDASVSALKDAIKEENPTLLKDFDASNQQLFLAKKRMEREDEKGGDEGKWLTKLEALESVGDIRDYKCLAFPDEKLRLIGLASDKLGEVNDFEAAVGKGPVHVLLEIPKTSGLQAIAFSSVKELEEMAIPLIDKALEAQDKKRVYPFSDLDTEHRSIITQKMKLTDRYLAIAEPTPLPNEWVPPYTWLNVAESNQRAQYMVYLETHLKGLLDEHKLSLLDLTEDETALSISDPRLPFDMTGTTDVMLVDSGSIQYREPLVGVRMVIRLKKKVKRHYKPQAFGELFNKNKVLTRVSIKHPKNAFDFIAAGVAEPGGSKQFSVPFIGEEFTKFKIDDFLPMPADAADDNHGEIR